MATIALKQRASRRARDGPRSADGVGAEVASAEETGASLQRVSPATLRAHWRTAFDAAEAALHAAAHQLPAEQLRSYGVRLAAERGPTAQLLQDFARNAAVAGPLEHLVLPPHEARRLLGLPLDVRACVINLDGVLIGSAAVHAEAWTRTFDEFLLSRSDRTHRDVAPFNPRTDYAAHMHGRPRLEGVSGFLASRGISLPPGRPDDPPGSETVHGIANRKNALLLQLLEQRPLPAFEGAREYLELARDAHVRCAVVSASANTAMILDRAGLTGLIDCTIDGNVIVARGLRPRPAPDILLAACDELQVSPRLAASFETSPAGISAARTAGFGIVIGVGRGDRTRELREAGADLVVTDMEELLEQAVRL